MREGGSVSVSVREGEREGEVCVVKSKGVRGKCRKRSYEGRFTVCPSDDRWEVS